MSHYESRNKVKPSNKYFKGKLFLFEIKKLFKTFKTKNSRAKICDENDIKNKILKAKGNRGQKGYSDNG